ncbi:MAG: ferric reductase-like transmembrane domain-containing protein [Candidatus Nanopelagicales bacterium]
MNVLWLATRSTGLAAIALLSVVVVLGIANTGGWGSTIWPRIFTSGLHKRIALLAVSLLAVHIITTIVDGYVSVGWIDAVVPFVSGYETFWLGLGTLGFDLLLVLIVSSLARNRMNPAIWRSIHFTAYGAWALAMIHALGVGTDSKLTLAIALTGAGAVALTAIARVAVPARIY